MKEIGGIPVVISRGAPYEIGYSHGKSHPDRVRKSYEYNLKSCLERGDVTKEELVRIAMGFVKPVERYNPDYIEEVQGIADGAGMKFEELMVLNSRTALYGQIGQQLNPVYMNIRHIRSDVIIIGLAQRLITHIKVDPPNIIFLLRCFFNIYLHIDRLPR